MPLQVNGYSIMKNLILTNRLIPEDPFLVIPKFDRVAVCLLFYMWWMMCGVASSGGFVSSNSIIILRFTHTKVRDSTVGEDVFCPVHFK